MTAFTISQVIIGDSAAYSFRIRERDGTPVDLTGSTFEMVFKEDTDSPVNLLTKSWTDHPDALDGETVGFVVAGETSAFPEGFVYVEVNILFASGGVRTVFNDFVPCVDSGRYSGSTGWIPPSKLQFDAAPNNLGDVTTVFGGGFNATVNVMSPLANIHAVSSPIVQTPIIQGVYFLFDPQLEKVVISDRRSNNLSPAFLSSIEATFTFLLGVYKLSSFAFVSGLSGTTEVNTVVLPDIIVTPGELMYLGVSDNHATIKCFNSLYEHTITRILYDTIAAQDIQWTPANPPRFGMLLRPGTTLPHVVTIVENPGVPMPAGYEQFVEQW